MVEALQKIFAERDIAYAEVIPFSEVSVLYPRKIAQLSFTPQSVIIFAIPYYAGEFDKRNLSRYAVAKDYHFFFRTFSDEVKNELQKLYPTAEIAAFADNSPIDEREAAAKAGLGMLGMHSLLITEKYGSYVFIGEFLTSIPYDKIGTLASFGMLECEKCGLCLKSCPKKETCLSALTQKKGELTRDEKDEIASLGSVWGCDICQEVCPHSRNAEFTPIAYFKEDLIAHLTPETVENMSEDEFAHRAYSWRGKKTILRNLLLFDQP